MPKVLVTTTIEETVEVEVTDEQLEALRQPSTGGMASSKVIDFCLTQANEAKVHGEYSGHWSDVSRDWVSTSIYSEDSEEEFYNIA